MGHVLVRLAGHGLVLTPYWPYSFQRQPAGRGVVLATRLLEHDRRQALVDPAAPAGHPGIVEVTEGPGDPDWLIETSAFAMPWPDGYSLESSTDPHDRTPFYLHGDAGQLIFPQGPAKVAGPDAFVAPGQTVLRRWTAAGAEVVELDYQHDGEPWWQAHFLMPYGKNRTLVLTAQSRLADAAGTCTAAESMVRGSR